MSPVRRARSIRRSKLAPAPAAGATPTGTVGGRSSLPALDGLRGMAALLVFASHAALLAFGRPDDPWLTLPMRGWTGVDIFFTLSGFLLALPLIDRGADAPMDWRRYLRRRALRILPAYWLQVLLLSVLQPGLPRSAVDLLVQLTMSYDIGLTPALPWLPVWWSLPVEFGFYLVLPLLAPLLAGRRWYWLVLLLPLAWTWRGWLQGAGLPPAARVLWADHLPGRIDQFVIGALAAVAWVRGGARGWFTARRVAALAALGIALVFAVHALPTMFGVPPRSAPGAGWRVPWHGFASLALAPVLVAAAAGGGSLLGWLSSRPMRALGLISYSLYLWHLPLMLLARSWGLAGSPAEPRPWTFMLLMLPPCLLLAWLSWRLVERPAQRLARAG